MLLCQNGEVWSISINNLKWCMLYSAKNSRIEYEFNERESFDLVVLALRNKELKEFFHFLILTFNLTIAFRVVGSGESSFNTEAFIKCLHVLGYKLKSTI